MGQPGAFPRPARPRTDRRPTRLLTRAAVLLASLAAVLSGTLVATPAAVAADPPNPVTPGDFTGLGFDQCLAPDYKAMDAWWGSSPYAAVGIYISGDSRGCRSQPNLTGWWVKRQLTTGWKLLPITLGPQASCTTRPRYLQQVRINANSAGDYSRARSQGVAEAKKAVAAAQKLGIVGGSVLWYDLEAFNAANTSCRDSALAFLSGWTTQLRTMKYLAGAYSSAASGIKVLADATKQPKRFTVPDYIWIADWNGVADTHTSYISDSLWSGHRRVHQYRGGHNETWGGVTINIDNNYLDTGLGSVPTKRPAYCAGIKLDFYRYPALKPGTTATAETKAAQCLLTLRGYYKGPASGTYDAATVKAVNALQQASKAPVTSTLSSQNWMTLLSVGSSPVIKLGTASEYVRRVQRALNATALYRLRVTGVADRATMDAVSAYRKRVGLAAALVGDAPFWSALRRGRT